MNGVSIGLVRELELARPVGDAVRNAGNPRDVLVVVGAGAGDELRRHVGRQAVREGDVGDGFYVVTSGSATVRRGGREVARLAPGDYFGELSLFDPAPRNATVTAAGPLSCVMLSRAAFTKALDEIPAIRDTLLQGMARRIHELDQRV